MGKKKLDRDDALSLCEHVEGNLTMLRAHVAKGDALLAYQEAFEINGWAHALMEIAAAAITPPRFRKAALRCIEEAENCDPIQDMISARSRRESKESMLTRCLVGAEPDLCDGWREYVETIFVAAEVQ